MEPEIQHAKQDAKETMLGLNHWSQKSNVSVTRTKLGLQLTLFLKFFIHFTYLLRPIPCDGMLCSALMQADGPVPASAYSLFTSDFNIASSLGARWSFSFAIK